MNSLQTHVREIPRHEKNCSHQKFFSIQTLSEKGFTHNLHILNYSMFVCVLDM